MPNIKVKNKPIYGANTTGHLTRTFSDMFSRQQGLINPAIDFAINATKGCCLYCGDCLVTECGGEYILSNNTHYDHIHSASDLNLFTRGNIAISCKNCNMSKGRKSPYTFYQERVSLGLPVLFNGKEFEKFIKSMECVYKKDFPTLFDELVENKSDLSLEDKIKNFFLGDINLTLGISESGWKGSTNHEVWQKIEDLAEQKYKGNMTATNIKRRLSFTNDFFCEYFGEKVSIYDCTVKEIEDFGKSLIEEKAYSITEVCKYRSLLKLLFIAIDSGSKNASIKSIPTFKNLTKTVD